MKKLLLAALAVLSTTAFSAIGTQVTNGTGTATLPITVQGNVLDTTTASLVVTPLRNAGVDGASMAFDFGDLHRGSSQMLSGTYQAEIIQNGVLAAATGGLIKSELVNHGTVIPSNQFKSEIGTDHVTIDYALAAPEKNLADPDKTHTGLLSVTVNVDK
ncbi:hypothetical protein, partial [Cetobacterium sp.]|uniref:hypothetical protein n=1 Tax=Cetobacterium sp. TaxID=2071632 RepID=UPI003EE7FAC1